MSSLLIHDLDTAWTSSNVALLLATADTQTFVAGSASNRLEAPAGAAAVFAEFVPGAPLDLTPFEELRFWIRASAPASGAPARPFYLELLYLDAGDLPGEEHRWFVPVSRAGVWEQRRVGIGADRRSAITRFRFRCLTTLPFVCHVDELIAVREEMLADLEAALVRRLESDVALPGVTNVALALTANPGDAQVVLPLNRGFYAANLVLLQGGTAGDELHAVTGVTHDTTLGRTTLSFAAADAVAGTLTAGVATASVVVPVLAETPPSSPALPAPAVVLTHLDAREDPQRTGSATQRDSFRPRGAVTVCSVRAPARAYGVDYQITVLAPERAQQLFVHTLLLQRLSLEAPLRINGTPSPVGMLPPPALIERRLGELAPVYVRIGTRMEIAPRREQTWVRRAVIEAAPIDARLDREEIELEL